MIHSLLAMFKFNAPTNFLFQNWEKVCLFFLGLLFLGVVTNTILAPILLLIISIITVSILFFINRITSIVILYFFFHGAVPFCFITIIFLYFLGLVGTLTGVSTINNSDLTVLFIGLPFYILSAQIAAGGPITLTHPEVTRYFMTIPEAAQLVIQASSMAVGGDVFVLDMGEPVQIYDLAVKMAYLSGYLIKDEANPHGDIEIVLTGLRPGEKLFEELLIGDKLEPTIHPKIMKAYEEFLSWDVLQQEIEKLNLVLESSNTKLLIEILKKLVPGYKPSRDLAKY